MGDNERKRYKPKLHYIDSDAIIKKVAEEHNYSPAVVKEAWVITFKIVRLLISRLDMPIILFRNLLRIGPEEYKLNSYLKGVIFKYKMKYHTWDYVKMVFQKYSHTRKVFKLKKHKKKQP